MDKLSLVGIPSGKTVDVIHDPLKGNPIKGSKLLLNRLEETDLFSQSLGEKEGISIERVFPVQEGRPESEQSHPGSNAPCVDLHEAGGRGAENFQVRLRRAVWKAIIEVTVDGLEDFWCKGIVNGSPPLPLSTVLGYPAKSLVIERPFEKSYFHSLEQLGQSPFKTVRREMGCTDEERHSPLFLHLPYHSEFLSFPPHQYAHPITRKTGLC
jgi:hypothetical protein